MSVDRQVDQAGHGVGSILKGEPMIERSVVSKYEHGTILTHSRSSANRPLPNSIDVDKFVTVSQSASTTSIDPYQRFIHLSYHLVESVRDIRHETSSETSRVSVAASNPSSSSKPGR
jgi:hypothetical protein